MTFLPGQRLAAEQLNAIGGGAAEDWSPTLNAFTSPPSLGTGATAVGRFFAFGQLVVAQFAFVFGTGSSPGSGSYQVPLPPGVAYSPLGGTIEILASGAGLVDATTSERRIGSVGIDVGGAFAYVRIDTDESPGISSEVVGSAAPWAWDDGDFLGGSFAYFTDAA